MSQLIALIIAIALGAIVTAIGYVLLGDAFTNNSIKGLAQQLINQGSQLEIAFMAYKATNGISAYDKMYADTTVFNTSHYYTATTDLLVDGKYLQNAPEKIEEVGGIGISTILVNGKNKVSLSFGNIPEELCLEINKQQGLDPITPADYVLVNSREDYKIVCYQHIYDTNQFDMEYILD